MAVVMHTFTLAHATKIRTQADHVVMNKGACDGLCHFVFKRAPEKRVRVRNDGQALGRTGAEGEAAAGFGLVSFMAALLAFTIAFRKVCPWHD